MVKRWHGGGAQSLLVWFGWFLWFVGLYGTSQPLQDTQCQTLLIHILNLRFSNEYLIDNIVNEPEPICLHTNSSKYCEITLTIHSIMSNLFAQFAGIRMAILPSSCGILNTKKICLVSRKRQYAMKMKIIASLHIYSSHCWLANHLLLPVGESINMFQQIMNGLYVLWPPPKNLTCPSEGIRWNLSLLKKMHIKSKTVKFFEKIIIIIIINMIIISFFLNLIFEKKDN